MSDDLRERVARWLCREVHGEGGLMSWAEVWEAYPEERRAWRSKAEEILSLLQGEPVGRGIMRCHRGHESPAGLWNCPVCTDPILDAVRRAKPVAFTDAVLPLEDDDVEEWYPVVGSLQRVPPEERQHFVPLYTHPPAPKEVVAWEVEHLIRAEFPEEEDTWFPQRTLFKKNPGDAALLAAMRKRPDVFRLHPMTYAENDDE